MDQATVPLLTPRQASARLESEHNVQQEPPRLANLRCAGGGPPFVRIGRWIRYPQDKLDDYGRRMAGPLMTTTRKVAELAMVAA